MVANFEKYLVELGDARSQLTKRKTENPFLGDYAPEMHETPNMDEELESWYKSLIGILMWLVEIGRVNIITEVSMMVSQISILR